MDRPGSTLPASAGLALVGYRATGKTTVGRLIADRLGRPFLDADAELERRGGRSIASLFADGGELAFRDLEERTIRDLCGEHPGAVLATGGGSVLRDGNRRNLRAFGRVLWLAAPAEVIVERLRREPGSRPALTASGLFEEVGQVLQAREPLYRSVADLIVDASPEPPRVVAEAALRLLSGEDRP